MMSRIGAYRPDIIFLVSAVNLKIACQATIIFEARLFRRIGPCLRVPMLCYLLFYSFPRFTRYSFPRFAWESFFIRYPLLVTRYSLLVPTLCVGTHSGRFASFSQQPTS